MPGLPKDFATAGPLPVSDLTPLRQAAGVVYGSADFPAGYFGQSAAAYPQPSYFESPRFTDEELSLFAANFGNAGLDVSQIFGAAGIATPAPKSAAGAADKVETDEKPAEKSADQQKGSAESSGKVPGGLTPKKSGAVQIVQDDVFNGQLPLL